MANLFSKVRAEPVVRAAATNTKAPDPAWADKVESLSGIVQYRVSATCITMLGTALLAKALNSDVNLFWFKPTHVGAADKARSYSARTLCHTVLVPLSAEYGFSLGVSGREPLNNQPFFRMERLDDGTPVNPAAQRAFDYMMDLIGEAQALPNRAAAEQALHAFISVRRRYVTKYEAGGEATIATPAALIDAIKEFMQLGSAGGSHAQAIAAGVMDAALDPERVESGRINDPSRHYPGDVCVWTNPEKDAVARAIEVRDKPVSASDIHIFARRCQTDGVQDCAVLMVSQNQPALDEVSLFEWADKLGLNLRLWQGWEAYIRESLFWSEMNACQTAATAAARVRFRLTEAEVSAEALSNWDALTIQDIPT